MSPRAGFTPRPERVVTTITTLVLTVCVVGTVSSKSPASVVTVTTVVSLLTFKISVTATAALDESKTEPRTVPELPPDCASTEAAKDSKPTTQTARIFFIGSVSGDSKSAPANSYEGQVDRRKQASNGHKRERGGGNATTAGLYEYCVPAAC